MGKYVDSNLVKDEHVVYETKLHWVVLYYLRVIAYFTSEFAITNMRLIVKVGCFSQRSFEIKLQHIESVSANQSLLGRILGYGTLTIVGTGGTKESLPQISHPLEFRNKVQEALQLQQATDTVSHPGWAWRGIMSARLLVDGYIGAGRGPS